MRIRYVTVFPERASFKTYTTVNDQDLELVFNWRAKTRAWYLSINDQSDGTAYASGVRLEAGTFPIIANGLLDEPFLLGVIGKDYDTQAALGTDIEILVVDRLDEE